MDKQLKTYDKIKQKIINHNDWKEFKCHYCSKQLSFNEINLDHIVPLGLLNQLGINVKEGNKYRIGQWDNLQMTCRRCNSLKSNKIDWYHPKTETILKHFMEEAKKEKDVFREVLESWQE